MVELENGRANHDDVRKKSRAEDESSTSNDEEILDQIKDRQLFSIAEEDGGEFDPYDFGNDKNATSFCGTIMHMIIVSLSPTLLNLPKSFNEVGYLVGVVGSFSTVILYAYCMHMIVASEYVLCKRLRRPNMTYTEVLYYAFAKGPEGARPWAKYMKRLIYLDFVVMWGGGNAIYVISICDNLKSAVSYLFDFRDLSDRAVMLYITVPLVLLCWIPNLKFLVTCSIFSNIINMCSIVVILREVLHNTPSILERESVGDFSKLPYFLGVIFVTVDGTGLLMSLKNQMRNPKKFKSKFGVLNVSYVPTGILYAVFGLLCCVKFGKGTQENILQNLENNFFGNAVKLLFSLSVVCFYPLCSYVTFDIVWNELLKGKFTPGVGSAICEYTVKTVNALGSIVLAYIVPDIEVFITLTGTMCASFHSIILPAVAEILIFYEQEGSRWRFIKNIFLVLLGLTLVIAGSVDSYFKLIDYYSKAASSGNGNS